MSSISLTWWLVGRRSSIGIFLLLRMKYLIFDNEKKWHISFGTMEKKHPQNDCEKYPMKWFTAKRKKSKLKIKLLVLIEELIFFRNDTGTTDYFDTKCWGKSRINFYFKFLFFWKMWVINNRFDLIGWKLFAFAIHFIMKHFYDKIEFFSIKIVRQLIAVSGNTFKHNECRKKKKMLTQTLILIFKIDFHFV